MGSALLVLFLACCAGPVAVDPLAPPRTGTFGAEMWAARARAAQLPTLLYVGDEAGGRGAANTAFGADALSRTAFALFFRGAVVIAGPSSGDLSNAYFFNPVVDGVVATRWRQAGASWALVSVEFVAGSRVRGGPPAVAPGWLADPQEPIAIALARAGLPTFDQLSRAPVLPNGGDRALLLARITVLQSGLASAMTRPTQKSGLARALDAIYSGKGEALRAVGADADAAQFIAGLPAIARGGLTSHGAINTPAGTVVAIGSDAYPRLVYLAGITADGRGARLTPVLLSATTKPGAP